MSQATYEKLRALRLPAMADTYLQIMDDPKMQSLSFTELMGIMTDAEWAQRKQIACGVSSCERASISPMPILQTLTMRPQGS
ncbi:MAG: ATP-binding protein [Clostridiales bacterium]|nr:ATP-binding protein [Clostridiales bacterium]MCK9350945.1 ATP-binding protein [Clostridiales bacterium]